MLRLEKDVGANTWVVRLVQDAADVGGGAGGRAVGGGTRNGADALPNAAFYGVDDWVYFKGDERSAGLIERVRCALGTLLETRVARLQTEPRGGGFGAVLK